MSQPPRRKSVTATWPQRQRTTPETQPPAPDPLRLSLRLPRVRLCIALGTADPASPFQPAG